MNGRLSTANRAVVTGPTIGTVDPLDWPDAPERAMSTPKIDGRLERGGHTRRLILTRAADIASVEGLDGLSIGRLAAELEVSKSGVFAHFGSKEELQLATLATARDVFLDAVIAPTLRAPAGLARVWELCDARLRYMSGRTFPGGCFFSTVAAEFHARPGRVRDAISASETDLLRFYETSIATAIELGELAPAVNPRQLAFELDALIRTAGSNALLFDDDSVFALARRAMLTRLRDAALEDAALPEVDE
jgi:AcrR family transcriptional regulator